MRAPYGAPIPDRGDRDQGHRPARPHSGGRQRAGGEANGQSIPVEKKVTRGREVSPGHLFLLTVTRNGRATR